MKRIMFGLVALVAMIALVGCGGEKEKLAAPEIVATVMDTNAVTVVWKEDTTVTNHPDFSGYNVYVYTDSTPLLSEDGEDLNAHNTNVITTNSYTATNLSKDSIYYIQVRTVNTDDKVGSYNTAVKFVKASPRPEFTVTVKLELYPGDSNEVDCGLRFETGAVTSESLNVFPGADVFFERFADTLQVNSASRRTASGFSPRTTLMKNFGQKDLDSLYQVTPSEISKDHEPFVVGDLIVFRTQENNYVKLHIDAYDSTAATVDVTYAYQNKSDFPYFSPKR